DRVDDLFGALAVGLHGGAARALVNHPAAHRYQQRAYDVHDPRMLEGADAASCQCEIDGATPLDAGTAWVGPTIPHSQGATTMANQHDTEKRAGEAGADYVDRLIEVTHCALQGISRNTCVRRSPNTNTSSKRLYNGMGATRMTSGSRQSQMTPS